MHIHAADTQAVDHTAATTTTTTAVEKKKLEELFCLTYYNNFLCGCVNKTTEVLVNWRSDSSVVLFPTYPPVSLHTLAIKFVFNVYSNVLKTLSTNRQIWTFFCWNLRCGRHKKVITIYRARVGAYLDSVVRDRDEVTEERSSVTDPDNNTTHGTEQLGRVRAVEPPEIAIRRPHPELRLVQPPVRLFLQRPRPRAEVSSRSIEFGLCPVALTSFPAECAPLHRAWPHRSNRNEDKVSKLVFRSRTSWRRAWAWG